jgi:uncharacterized protein YxeA
MKKIIIILLILAALYFLTRAKPAAGIGQGMGIDPDQQPDQQPAPQPAQNEKTAEQETDEQPYNSGAPPDLSVNATKRYKKDFYLNTEWL